MNLKGKINQFLNLDIYIPNKKEFFIIATLLGVVAYLELELLEPWDLYLLNPEIKSLVFVGYGVIESLVFLIAFALPLVLYRRDKKGTVDKMWKLITLFIFKIVVMATAVVQYNMFRRGNSIFHSEWIPNQVIHVFAIGLFPFSMLIFWFGYRSLIFGLSNSNQSVVTDIDTCIIVKSPQKGSNIKIRISDILYIKSDRNYLEINYIEDSIEKVAVHRGSLSAMIDELPKDIFCRIHNSYLVRLSLITTPYTVNSAYFIRLIFSKDIVLPVSRTYLKAVREMIAM